ncbi:MAG: YitT family protein [Prevotella sp.]|jgi:uncharacterized membrane-anchored protein YitT (DUF2179 family)|nr:YitT family protein [Prevotella sp.]MCI1282584.1 YitT family protein [Prevotella sp.]
MEATKIERRSKYRTLRDCLIIALAMLMGSVGWVLFLLPNEITTGGVAGISSIIYWGFHIPPSIIYFALNAILLACALKILGWKFCAKTLYAVALFTLFSSLLQTYTADIHLLADQKFMALIVGGAFIGTSVGLGLSCGGSTGGSDVIAAIVRKYKDISLGHIILLCDLCIITSSYLVLKDWEKVIYGYVLLFISSFCVDQVVNAMRRSVQFFIISDEYEAIGRAINEIVPRGCTIFDGHGFYSGKNIQALFVIAKKSESSMIFRLIEDIDPKAFVSQSSVIGVYGLGFDNFRRRSKGKLKEDQAMISEVLKKE